MMALSPREPRPRKPRRAGSPAREESLRSAAPGKQRGPGSLTEMVFQSPSRKLRRGVRKLTDAVWMNSLSAAPRRFSASATLINVFPDEMEFKGEEGARAALTPRSGRGREDRGVVTRHPRARTLGAQRLPWENVEAAYVSITWGVGHPQRGALHSINREERDFRNSGERSSTTCSQKAMETSGLRVPGGL